MSHKQEKSAWAQMREDVKTLREFLSYPLYQTQEVFDRFKTLSNTHHVYKNEDEQFLVRPESSYFPPRVLLVAHADTVWLKSRKKPVLKLKKGIFYNADENPETGIGADDRAGCAILWALHKMGHSLLITSGEEKGMLGSHYALSQDLTHWINQHAFVLQFDRQGARDFKCYDVGSNAFRDYVQLQTGYTEPNRFSFTDICTLCTEVCGANLSVGYYHEHSKQEYINVREWLHTLNVVRVWLSEAYFNRYTQYERKIEREDFFGIDDSIPYFPPNIFPAHIGKYKEAE